MERDSLTRKGNATCAEDPTTRRVVGTFRVLFFIHIILERKMIIGLRKFPLSILKAEGFIS